MRKFILTMFSFFLVAGLLSAEVIPRTGDVYKVGTPVDNQVGVWTGDGTIEGTTGLTFDASMGAMGAAAYNISDKKVTVTTFTSAGINAAIDALGSEGGEVYMPEGEYAITADVVIDYDNTTLRGAGVGTILKVPDGTDAGLDIINVGEKDNCTLMSFSIDGNRDNNTGLQHGVNVETAIQTKIVGLHIYNMNNDGIYVPHDPIPIQMLIRDCKIYNIDDDGIDINRVQYSVITGNIFKDIGDNGIDTEGAKYCTFVGNVIDTCGGSGIELEDEETGACQYCTVVGNTIKSVSEDGIRVASGQYNTVSGNVIDGALYGIQITKTSNGLESLYNIVSNNYIEDCTGCGIRESPSHNSDYNVYIGNLLRNCEKSYEFHGTYNCVVRTDSTGVTFEGKYVHVGDGGDVGYVSGDGDVYVKDDIECDGIIYSKGIQMSSSTKIQGAAADTHWFIEGDSSYDQVLFLLGESCGRQLVIGNALAEDSDFDHAMPTNPTIYLHSATDPDTANDQWISLSHDQTNGVIATGTGDLYLSPASGLMRSDSSFLVGSSQMDDTGDSSDDARMFFDKSSGAFRAGTSTAVYWNDFNRGTNSFGVGFNVIANGDYGASAQGYITTASGDYGAHSEGTLSEAYLNTQHVHSSGMFATIGDAQTSKFEMRITSNTAAESELFIDGDAETIRAIIPEGTAWAFTVTLVGKTTTDSAVMYEARGIVIRNGADTTIRPKIGAVYTTIDETDMPSCGIAVTADNTYESLKVAVTGKDGVTIRWVAGIKLVEVGF